MEGRGIQKWGQQVRKVLCGAARRLDTWKGGGVLGMVTEYYSSRAGWKANRKRPKVIFTLLYGGRGAANSGTSVALYEPGWSGLRGILRSNGGILARA